MKKQYSKPTVEKITFNYKNQIYTSGTDCFESVLNERPSGGESRECVGGTPIPIGWTEPQTYVD